MYYFDKLIFSSCGIKENTAAVSFNDQPLNGLSRCRYVLTRRVTQVIFTHIDNCMSKKTKIRLISWVKKIILEE